MVTLKLTYRLSASFNDFYELLLIVEYSPYDRFD